MNEINYNVESPVISTSNLKYETVAIGFGDNFRIMLIQLMEGNHNLLSYQGVYPVDDCDFLFQERRRYLLVDKKDLIYGVEKAIQPFTYHPFSHFIRNGFNKKYASENYAIIDRKDPANLFYLTDLTTGKKYPQEWYITKNTFKTIKKNGYREEEFPSFMKKRIGEVNGLRPRGNHSNQFLYLPDEETFSFIVKYLEGARITMKGITARDIFFVKQYIKNKLGLEALRA